MFRSNAMRVGLAAVLALASSLVATAQETTSPEGLEWHLMGYAVEGEVGLAPWSIDATLVLQDGTATGSTGCNSFSGTYLIDEEKLTFDPTFTLTRLACPADRTALEDAYLADLPRTASWAIEDGTLRLADASGEPLLDFEQGVVELTASDVATLAALLAEREAQLEQLDQRIDDIRIGTLRDRIKELESQVSALRSAAASSASSGAFTSAERLLLRGIPNRIRNTCAPLRSSLPGGTLAAVRCDPGSDLVEELAYYLMPYASAERTFLRVMRSNGVPERFRCDAGRPSQGLQSPYHATGCFSDDSGANVRLVTWAANCQQLDVDGKRVKEPVAYIAVTGTDSRIRPLFEWATTPELELTPVWANIPVSGTPASPACRGLAP